MVSIHSKFSCGNIKKSTGVCNPVRIVGAGAISDAISTDSSQCNFIPFKETIVIDSIDRIKPNASGLFVDLFY